jgi:hypothetical protein
MLGNAVVSLMFLSALDCSVVYWSLQVTSLWPWVGYWNRHLPQLLAPSGPSLTSPLPRSSFPRFLAYPQTSCTGGATTQPHKFAI